MGVICNAFNQSNWLKALGILALLASSAPSSAHILGLAWNDLGNGDVRFYGETAHELAEFGLTEDSDTLGGALQIGPWATREYYAWTGIEIGSTFDQLGIDGWAYWDYTDEFSTIGDHHPDSHRAGPESSLNYFYVDVSGLVTGDYQFQLYDTSALERPVSYSYLYAHIDVSHVPIPPAVWLFACGLLGLIGVARKDKA